MLMSPAYPDPNRNRVAEVTDIQGAINFISPDLPRDEWAKVAMAIKSEMGDGGFDIFNVWSSGGTSYKAQDARATWRSINGNGGVGIGSLFHLAKQAGWKPKKEKLTEEEKASRDMERRKHQAKAKAAAEAQEARKLERQEQVAKECQARWDAAEPADPDHPYLKRKGVQQHGLRQDGKNLLVPMYSRNCDKTQLVNIQTISREGQKMFQLNGTVKGAYFSIGRLRDNTVLICEGFATGASLHEATGHAVAVAFNCGNLGPVAKALRAKYPDMKLTLCADDDYRTDGNPGISNATEAARAVGGLLAVPDFGTDRPEGMTDLNDMAQHCGTEAVKRAIANASTLAKGELSSDPANAPGGVSEGRKWPEPQPLSVKVEPEPYPVDALPDTIRAAVEEVAGFVKAPLPLVASSAIAALSLAIQSYADVKRAEKLQGPVGLFLLTIADSGERKSTCDGFFTSAIRDYVETQADTAKPILKDYKAAIEAWDAKRGGIKDKIRQLAKAQKSTAEMESLLRDLEHEKPVPPRVPNLLYDDATPEALAYELAKQWPSGGVVSAEAGTVFGSHGMGKDSIMRNLALLNQLWDGTSLTIDRRTSESFTVKGARLTVALQIQEATLQSFFDRSGGLARGMGFLSRFLIAWPESTQGSRFFTEAPANWPHLAAFHRRITAILANAAPIDDDGALSPAMLTMTPEAKASWVEYHDAVEVELRNGGDAYDVRDVASKSADNAARLAALFQMFEHGMGAVSLEAFEGASPITAWHLHEARRFFGELALPAELADAARLDSWLIQYCRRERTHNVGKNHVRQHGPLRDGPRLDAASRELTDLDRLRLEKEGRRWTIYLNPALVGVAP